MRKSPNEYHTEDYGTLFRSTITGFLTDTLGAKTEHKRDGNILIFNPEVIEKLLQTDKTKIIVKEIVSDIKSNDEEEDSEEVTEEYMNDCEGVKAVSAPATGVTEIECRKEKEQNIENSNSINQHQEVKPLILINENYNIKDSNTPPSNAFTVLTPSHSGRSSIILQQGEFNNPLISESDLTTSTYDPKIINSIHRFEGTDRWFCKNCAIKGDKWFMMKHPCKDNK
jgi:hypothetical protein